MLSPPFGHGAGTETGDDDDERSRSGRRPVRSPLTHFFPHPPRGPVTHSRPSSLHSGPSFVTGPTSVSMSSTHLLHLSHVGSYPPFLIPFVSLRYASLLSLHSFRREPTSLWGGDTTEVSVRWEVAERYTSLYARLTYGPSVLCSSRVALRVPLRSRLRRVVRGMRWASEESEPKTDDTGRLRFFPLVHRPPSSGRLSLRLRLSVVPPSRCAGDDEKRGKEWTKMLNSLVIYLYLLFSSFYIYWYSFCYLHVLIIISSHIFYCSFLIFSMSFITSSSNKYRILIFFQLHFIFLIFAIIFLFTYHFIYYLNPLFG